MLDLADRPIIHPVYLNGVRQLLGYPCYVSPSMPEIAASAKPILFGALAHVAFRKVENSGIIVRISERFIDKLQVGFRASFRCNGALMYPGSVSPPVASPVNFLQMAA
jgi:HK97 family phage major capsid protein